MSRTEPLITPEELQCLLGGGAAAATTTGRLSALHWGALLWMVKGVALYTLFFSPDAAGLAYAGRYVWMRGALEMLCLAVFWGAAVHPRGASVARGAMLVASTTLIMDLLKLLALP